ncbi:MAG: hypothetical protein QOJ69_1494, partial [Actinomycetota bacterium]|nr:hypothetical protein [Actinomycetota bacterium]
RAMPIAKGSEYGAPGPVPDGLVVVRSDAEARAALEQARRERRPYPPLGLLGGDLCRTLGGGAGRELVGVRFPVDLGVVLADGRVHLFVASLVARTRLWTRAFVAMNAQWAAGANLGPRAHPGDGLLDIYDARLSLRQVLAVRARARHGAHLPHPGIRERRSAALQVELERPLPLWLDGVVVGEARTLALRVEPDALVVVI